MINLSEKKLISFVVPVFNEEENILPLYETVTTFMIQFSKRYDYEILFTDNHSTDSTFEKLEQIARTDQRVRVLRFSKNFGYQKSIYTGYVNAVGDVAIQLDCDLQDPIDLIPDFFRYWEEGFQVVYGVRISRKEAWWINKVRSIFYWFIDFLSEDHLPRDAGDFRLVDKVVLEQLRQMDDSQPYLRGSIATLGFNQKGIPYHRNERERGVSKFSFKELVRLAIDGILNHSLVPLRIATYTGLTVSVITFFALILYLLGKLFGADWPAGFATTTILILLSISLNALFLGIIGEYLGRIYQQVKKKPITVIESGLNSMEFHKKHKVES